MAPQHDAAAEKTVPAAILRCTSGIYDVAFLGARRLLSGGTAGDISVWDLEDQRIAAAWSAAHNTVISLHGLDKGQSCLSQTKDGWLKLWDIQSQSVQWDVHTGSCSFARAVVSTNCGDSAMDVAPAACAVCCPLAEPHELGVFDLRGPPQGARAGLKLRGSAAPAKSGAHAAAHAAAFGGSPLGMCMALCGVPALGASYVLAVYESTDACIWDLRSPSEPAVRSVLAGDPGSPAICAAVLWRHIWVGCADGNMHVLHLKRQGNLEKLPKAVQVSHAPHMQNPEHDPDHAWQTEKSGVNMLAVRPDLRLVAAARWDRRVELFDTKTMSSLGRLHCHDGGVLCASFDPEQGVFATGSEDGRIALWDTLASTYTGPVQPRGESAEAVAAG